MLGRLQTLYLQRPHVEANPLSFLCVLAWTAYLNCTGLYIHIWLSGSIQPSQWHMRAGGVVGGLLAALLLGGAAAYLLRHRRLSKMV